MSISRMRHKGNPNFSSASLQSPRLQKCLNQDFDAVEQLAWRMGTVLLCRYTYSGRRRRRPRVNAPVACSSETAAHHLRTRN